VLTFLEANPCSTKQQINSAVKNGSLAVASLVKQGLVAEIKTNDPTTNRRTAAYSITHAQQEQTQS